MANFSVIGILEGVRYTQDGAIATISEYRRGYTKADGTVVDETLMHWKVIYKAYFKKYISSNFRAGALVAVKGEISPYAIHSGEVVDGYSIKGETLNLASFPKNLKRERRMLRESQLSNDDNSQPDVASYREDDF